MFLIGLRADQEPTPTTMGEYNRVTTGPEWPYDVIVQCNNECMRMSHPGKDWIHTTARALRGGFTELTRPGLGLGPTNRRLLFACVIPIPA